MNWVEIEMVEEARKNQAAFCDAWVLNEPRESECLHRFESQTVPKHLRHRFLLGKRSFCAKCGAEA